MIDITCQPPNVRAAKIMDAYGRVQDGDEAARIFREFSVNVDRNMMNVDARMLPAPVLSYNPQSRAPTIQPSDGAWNLRDKKVFVGTELKAWAVICFADQQRTFPPPIVQNFVRQMVQTCNSTGLRVSNQQPELIWEPSAIRDQDTIGPAFEKALRGRGGRPQLILCLLPVANSTMIYNALKFYADTVVGIRTQCVLEKHVAKAAVQYCANVCMKMNLKLGGINQQLANNLTWVSERPTMVIGADVSIVSG